jgi:hypothetical protein
MKLTNLALGAALILSPAVIFAQQTTTPPATPPTIGQRKVDQQDRIAQGVKSGQLTAGETSRLEHQESGINHEERGMRAEDNGHLSSADKKLLAKQQNQESRRIYRDKHNGRVR